jgi:hypothetical protein
MEPGAPDAGPAAPPAEAPAPAPERDAAAEASQAAASKRAVLTKELRRARGWILGVGIAIYTVDMFFVWGTNEEWPAWVRYQVSLLDGIILAIFVGLWWYAEKKPRLCCVLALVVYWGLQVWLAWISKDSSMLFKGPLLKILFTLALIKGIQSAKNAEKMRADLAQVFG